MPGMLEKRGLGHQFDASAGWALHILSGQRKGWAMGPCAFHLWVVSNRKRVLPESEYKLADPSSTLDSSVCF